MSHPLQELFAEFQAASVSRLDTINRCLLTLEESPAHTATTEELLREVHTLKGESRILGLSLLNGVIHRLEDALLIAVKQAFADSAFFDVSFSGLDVVQLILAGDLTVDPDANIQKAARQFLAALDGFLAGRGEQTPASVSAPEPEPLPVPAAEPMGDLQRELLAEFQAASVSRLDTINRCLLTLEESPTHASTTEELLREVHTLKGESRILGLSLLNNVIHRLEDVLLLAVKQAFADSAFFDVSFSGLDVVQLILAGDLSVDPDANTQKAARQFLAALDGFLAGRGEQTAAPAPVPAPVPEPMPVPEPGPVEDLSPASAVVTTASGGGRTEFMQIAAHRVEGMTNLCGELLLWQTRMEHLLSDMKRLLGDWKSTVVRARELEGLSQHAASKLHALSKEMGVRVGGLLDEGFENRLRLQELQDTVGRMRLVEVRTVFARYPRAVRDLGRELGKDCRVVLRGEDVAIDRQVLSGIEDALLHLVRNSVDHGIESPEVRRHRGKPEKGTIELSAVSTGPFVEISISDDGGGIPAAYVAESLVKKGLMTREEVGALSREALVQQIFRPGFSTREAATDISGRGVGTDVVKQRVSALGGNVRVETVEGKGTRFVLSLPMSTALTSVMVFRQDRGLYAIPSAAIESILHLLPSAVETIWGARTFRLEGRCLGLYDLDALLGFGEAAVAGGAWSVVILQAGEARVGIRVKRVVGERLLVQQACDPFLENLRLLTGTARVEGGELAMVLNPPELALRARGTLGEADLATGAAPVARGSGRAGPPVVLIVEDSDITRRVLVSTVGKLGYTVIDAINGKDGLEKYRERRPDLVMTDLDMPVMGGLQLLRALQEEGATCPRIVVTTRDTAESRAETRAAGADGYVVKSMQNFQELTETLQRLVPPTPTRAAS